MTEISLLPGEALRVENPSGVLLLSVSAPAGVSLAARIHAHRQRELRRLEMRRLGLM